jgi:hypothetical protein
MMSYGSRASLLALLAACSSAMAQQVSVVTRNPASYTRDVFAYQGSRVMQVDEASSPGQEDNVFIFSKVDRGAKPDVMYFQRFTKVAGQWTLGSSLEIRHEGIISLVGNRKAFNDADQDKSVDALFVYALNDHELKQQSIHLLLSHSKTIYTIAAYKADNYASSRFSDNFAQLSPAVKSSVLAYWSQLDKADK